MREGNELLRVDDQQVRQELEEQQEAEQQENRGVFHPGNKM